MHLRQRLRLPAVLKKTEPSLLLSCELLFEDCYNLRAELSPFPSPPLTDTHASHNCPPAPPLLASHSSS